MLLSAGCILHCLGLPLAIIATALSLAPWEAESFHLLMLLVICPVTLWVVVRTRAWIDHRSFLIMALIGLGLMLGAVLMPPLAPYEVPVTITGGLLLATAHGWRWHQQHRALTWESGGSER